MCGIVRTSAAAAFLPDVERQTLLSNIKTALDSTQAHVLPAEASSFGSHA